MIIQTSMMFHRIKVLKKIATKKIVKKYRNLVRKKPYQRPTKKTEDDVVF